MTRPPVECLDRLENQADNERVKRLIDQFDQFFIQASKYAIELKAYQKLIADSEKHARSDPNSQHWLHQIQEKSARQSQVQHAINQLTTQAVQQIDQHIRSEAISIIRALLSDGFFDKPGKSSSSHHTNLNSNASSIAIKTVEKNVENERKEREESFTTLKKDFEDYQTFNNTRYDTLQASFEEYKESNQTRFKNLEDTHRKQICSLKASIQISKLNNPEQHQQHSQDSFHPPPEQTEPHPLKQLIQEQVTEQLAASRPEPDIPTTDLVSKQSFQIAINQIKDQLDQLGIQTTETLKEFEPQIKQITQAIQVQVIKSTKSVIADGHQDIASLINDSIVKLQDQVDKLEPIITHSSEKISEIESIKSSLDSRIDEKIHSAVESKPNEERLAKLEGQITQKLHSKLEAHLDEKLDPKLEAFKKQVFVDLTKKQQESDKKYNASFANLQTEQDNSSESIGKLEKTVTDVQSQFKEFELRIKPLQDRIDGVETTVQNSNHVQRNQSRRLSTPAHQSSHSLRRTSQTPPSPESHRSSNINNSRSQPPFPPPGPYSLSSESKRQFHKGNRGSISSSSAVTSQSQNVPIASRLTNGPSQGGPQTGPGQANGEMAHYHNGTFSREPSIFQPTQPNVGGTSHWPSSAAAVGPGQSHNYTTQALSYELQPDQTHAHAGHQQTQQPLSSIPLAKRLKNDYSANSYSNNHDQQASYQHFHPPHQQQQQSYPQHPPTTNSYKKNFYTKRT